MYVAVLQHYLYYTGYDTTFIEMYNLENSLAGQQPALPWGLLHPRWVVRSCLCTAKCMIVCPLYVGCTAMIECTVSTCDALFCNFHKHM